MCSGTTTTSAAYGLPRPTTGIQTISATTLSTSEVATPAPGIDGSGRPSAVSWASGRRASQVAAPAADTRRSTTAAPMSKGWSAGRR